MSVHLVGASAFEVQSSDSDEVESKIIDVYCNQNYNVTHVMQCLIFEDGSTFCSRDVAVRCQGRSLYICYSNTLGLH